MKKFTLLVILIMSSFLVNAQDKIYLKSGEQIEAKIIEVNQENIKYKKYSNLNGPTFIKNLNEIHMVVYQNGENEIFKENENTTINHKESDDKLEFKRNRIYLQLASISDDGFVFIPNIAYEIIRPDGKWGAEFSLDYRALSTTSYDISILRLGGAYNYYTKGNGKGFYVGPAAALAFISYSDYNGSIDFTALDLGGQIGGQFQLTSLFGLNLRGKLGYLLPFASGGEGAFYYDILAGINFSF